MNDLNRDKPYKLLDDETVREKLAQRIRALRRQKGISQKGLADMIGIMPAPLNNIEQGRQIPTGRMLILLADALEVTIDDLLGIAPDAWKYKLARRMKHRFGVSAQSFVYRLLELELITQNLADEFRRRIEVHYRDHLFLEPEGTKRKLMPNGRLGDLAMVARNVSGRVAEVREIKKMLAKAGVKL